MLHINRMLLNETNAKQTILNKEKIKYQLRTLHRNIKLITADSTDWTYINSDWLPGSLLNVFQGNVVAGLDIAKIKMKSYNSNNLNSNQTK